MLSTVTIEVGFVTREPKLATGKLKNDKRAKSFDAVHQHEPTSGFFEYTGLIDIRRMTNMHEVVRKARMINLNAHISTVLSEVHFKMLRSASPNLVLSPMHSVGEAFRLSCKKYTDRKTGIQHSLVVTVKAISIPRLENTDY